MLWTLFPGVSMRDQLATSSPVPRFEAEPAQRRFLGSLTVDEETWWSGTLTFPDDSDVAFIDLVRHGPKASEDEQLSAMVPRDEVSAIAELLTQLASRVERG